jgi:DNA-binding CsgD family transcriptional regulator
LQVWIPITSSLAAAMASWERRPGPFLLRPDNRPWTRYALATAWQRERERNSRLRPLGRQAIAGMNTHDDGLVIHGLRGFACVRLRRAGVTVPLIADTVGMSEQMVAKYCRLSLQKDNATAAVEQMEHHRNTRQLRTDRVGGK